MRKALLMGLVLVFSSSLLQADYFFLPQRNLFNFRPDLFVYGSPWGYCPPPLYVRPLHCSVASHFVPGPRWRTTYQIIINSPAGMEIVRANTADLIFKVNPARALVYIDGKLIGNAGDFATERDRIMLVEGDHRLRIEFPGHQTFQTDMQIVPNRTLTLDIDLEKLP